MSVDNYDSMSPERKYSSPKDKEAGDRAPAQEGSGASLQVKDIAVVGMSGRFPGAANLGEFWNNLVAGRCEIGEVPKSRWDMEPLYDPDGKLLNKAYCKWGGFVDGIEYFDPLFFRISPRQAIFLDPQQRLFLEECWKAIEDAGYSARELDGAKWGVFVGCKAADYQMRLFSLDPNQTDPTDGHLVGGNDISMLPARISYFLNLRGPSIPINTACSSSMVALHLACESINSGVCEAAIVGGVEFMTTPGMFISLSASGALSRTGLCRAFDDQADGMILGEGVCAVILKPLNRALEGGDHIYGVIKASGLNQDGRSNGINAPNGGAQTDLECEVYRAAGINPETLGYVEAHGTGTTLGDPIEVNALTDAFSRFTAKKTFCPIGSLKANIGHPLSAAGLAGLIKILLCFEHSQIPPLVNFSAYNRHIDFENSPFYVNKEALAWSRGGNSPRRAALSSFGFSGTNGHVVIEEAPAPATYDAADRAQLILISARTQAALKRKLSDLAAWLEKGPQESHGLSSIAYTLHRGRSHFQWRAAFVVNNTEELVTILKEHPDQPGPGKNVPGVSDQQRVLLDRVSRRLEKGGLDEVAYRGALMILAESYLAGLLPDWKAIYGRTPVRRVPLPTYPFERERYWIEADNDALVWPGIAGASPADSSVSQATQKAEQDHVSRVFRRQWRAENRASSPLEGDLLLFDRGENLWGRLRSRPEFSARRVILVEPGAGFERITQDRYVLDANSFESFSDLIRSLCQDGQLPAHCLFLWGIEGGERRDTGERLLSTIYPLTYLARAWATNRLKQKLSLIFAHNTDNDLAIPEYAAVAAFARTIAAEGSRVNCRSVAVATDADAAGIADLLVAELHYVEETGAEVLWRKGERLLGGWVEADAARAKTDALHRGGVYVITGGAGGIGSHLAEFLAREYAASVVLVGRSEAGDQVSELIRRLENCGGRAIYVAADISDRAAVASAIESARLSFGAINGVFHLAGVHRDAFLANKSSEQMKEVLAPKVQGTVNLDEATLSEPLDCFVLFSSLAAIKGNPGQCDYAYANQFLNEFAEWRHALGGARKGRTLSICWPYWEGGGMLMNDADLAILRSRFGLAPLPADEAFRCMQSLLASDFAQAAVVYGESAEVGRIFEHPQPAELPAHGGQSGPSDEATLKAKTESMLRRLVAEVTNLRPEEIDPRTSFEDYGIDSVMIKSFNSKLEAAVGGLPTTLLFEYQTVTDLAAYLVRQHPALLSEKFGFEEAADHSTGSIQMPRPVTRQPLPVRPPSTERRTGQAPHQTDRMDFAIIGVSGRYPDAPTLEQFWRNLAAGLDSVREVPRSRWNVNEYFDPDPDRARDGKMYCKWGGFLEDVAGFDASFFRISPREAEMMDPQERMFLETAWLALEDAGYPPSRLKKVFGQPRPPVGVFVGVTTNSYQLFGPEEWLKGNQVFPISAPWSIANRVSYLFNFGGPSLPVDTACSSSLVAVHLACESLRRGECKMVLAGGVNLYLHPSKYVGMCQAHLLSPRGKCHAFGARGDGFVPGEGVGAILIRPLEEALEEGDRIYGIIKGTAVNHGGKTSSYSVPNPQAQAALVKQAIDNAGIDANTISFVEAHGTGTELGDPIEIRGLTLAFSEATDRKQFCAVSSLKSNIGHLEAAAGIAGLTKILLQFKHNSLAPSLHAESLNSNIDFDSTPFYVQRELAEWPQASGDEDRRRRAGVSSFGAGGTNAHVIVEEPPPVESRRAPSSGPHLVLLSAKTEERLKLYASLLLDTLRERGEAIELGDLAYTLQVGREPLSVRFATVVNNRSELTEALGEFVEGRANGVQVFLGRIDRDRKDRASLLEGEEGRAFIDVVLRRKNLAKLAQLWVEGTEIDWDLLHTDARPGRIELPLYPFERKPYWIPQSPGRVGVSALHPLIGLNVSTLREQKYRLSLDANEFYLRDHLVAGESVLPGVAYLEMARAAGELAAERAVSTLRNIVWVNRLAVTNGGASAEIRLDAKDGAVSFTVASTGQSGEQLHAQGDIMFDDPPGKPANLDLRAIESRCPGLLKSSDCYPADGARSTTGPGLHLGPSLRSIRQLRIGSGELIADLEIPSEVRHTASDFVLHPSILDGALQAILALHRSDGGAAMGKFFFPFSVERVTVWGRLPAACRAYIQLVEKSDDRRGATEKYNIVFADSHGAVVARLDGYVARVIDAKALPVDTASSTRLFHKGWTPSAISEAPVEFDSAVLLLDNDDRIAAFLRDRFPGSEVILVRPGVNFKRLGAGSYQVRADVKDDYIELFGELAATNRLPQRIAIAWTALESCDSARLLGVCLARSIHTLYSLSQALLEAGGRNREASVVFLRRSGSLTDPLHCGVAGFARSANQERLGLQYKAVVVPLTIAAGELGHIVAAELRGPKDAEVSYRGGVRNVPAFIPSGPQVNDDGLAPIRAGGVCLIAGGTGILGLRFAEYLFEEFRARLVLIDSTPPAQEAARHIDELRNKGADVISITADLQSRDEVFACVERVRQERGSIHAVIHVAGVLKEGYLADKDRATVEEVLGARVGGILLLDEATAGEPLDLFFACSSTSASMGNPAQTDYSFAHGFLEGFIESRNDLRAAGQRSGRSLVVELPLLEEVHTQVAGAALDWLDKTMGLRMMPTAAALNVFSRALSQERHWLMALYGDSARIERLLDSRRAEPTEFVRASKSATADLKALLTSDLVQMAAELLRMPAEEIDVNRQLDEFGFESVSLIDFTNGLNRKFGIALMPTLFFERTTIASVAEGLAEQHRDSIAQHYQQPVAESVTTEPAAQQIEPAASALPPQLRFAQQSISGPSTEYVEEPIAIVGMSGAMPQSEDLDEFWNNLVAGRDLITEVPRDRWRWEELQEGAGSGPDTTSKWGAFLKEVDKFDPLFFGISPKEAALMDPQHRLFIEHTWRAIEVSGHRPSDLSGTRTAVYVGMSVSDYAELIRSRLSEVEAHAALGISSCMLPNRISYLLNLHGPSDPIDTGCSSAAIAIHRAIEAIRHEDCPFAIAGGVSVMLNPMLSVFFSKSGVMSSDNRCRAFDEKATGTLRGEGVGVVLLKPLSAALRDRNPIFALIRASAENHGGRASSLTAPNSGAQAEVIVSAWQKANIDPQSVTYIEAHGTGTALGDPVEINGLKEALKQLYKKAGLPPAGDHPVGVGSAKTNVGHLLPAAAMPSIFKVVLGLQHRLIPANLHFQSLNKFIDLDNSPLYVVERNTPWNVIRGKDGKPLPRRAGVSSFGMGGANAHLVLEEWTADPPPSEPQAGPFLFIMSARDQERLRVYAQRMIEHLEVAHDARLDEVAYTLQVGREAMDERLAVLAHDRQGLISALRSFVDNRPSALQVQHGNKKAAAANLTTLLDKDDTRGLLERAYAAADLKKLMSLWMAGVEVDWGRLYPVRPRRVVLPTYPFARIRCWLNEDGQIEGSAVELTEAPGGGQRSPTFTSSNISPPAAQRAPETLYYDWQWTAEEIELPERLQAGKLLVLGGDERLIDGLRAVWPADADIISARFGTRYSEESPRSFVVDPKSGDDFVQMLSAIKRAGEAPSHIAFFWDLSEPDPASDARPVGEGAYSLFHLAKAYERMQVKRTLSRIACFAQVRPQTVFPHFDALSGYANSLSQVMPNLQFSVVTLAGQDSVPAVVRDELTCCNPADEVRRENGRRLRKRYSRFLLDGAGSSAPLRDEGVYLITGGMGGLGQLFAKYLSRRFHARLALLGRSPLDAEKEQSLRQIERLGGEAIYIPSDVTDRASLELAISEAKRHFRTLHGVIHAAGTANKIILTNKSLETFEDALETKIRGTQLLDSLTTTDRLDFFALFSSTSVMLGDMAQGDYAVGNRFMDSYAYYRDSLRAAGERSGATVCVNWPLWREGGIHLEDEASALHYSSMAYLETQDGIEAFEKILASSRPQTILIVSTDPARVEEHLNGAQKATYGPAKDTAQIAVSRPTEQVAPEQVAPEQVAPARAARSTDARELLEADLRAMASELLHLDARYIDAEEDLINIGVDSITLASFVARLNERFEFLDISQTSLFGARSLNALTDLLIETKGEAFTAHYSKTAKQAAAGTNGGSRWPAELVPIQTGGVLQPTFWAPGSYGFSQSFKTLPQALGREFPIYAFHARGNDGKRLPFVRIQNMAAHYINCMRHVQPHGPYLLGGYSFGGLVAFEMAQQLVRGGDRVAALVMFDTYPPTQWVYDMTQNADEQFKMNIVLANFLTGHGEWGDTIKAEDLADVPPRMQNAYLVELIAERGKNPLLTDELFGIFKGAQEVNDHASEAYKLYKPAPYTASRVLYVKSKQGIDDYIAGYDYLAVWRELIPRDMEVVEVAYKHSQLMSRPALDEVGERLRSFLLEAAGQATAGAKREQAEAVDLGA